MSLVANGIGAATGIGIGLAAHLAIEKALPSKEVADEQTKNGSPTMAGEELITHIGASAAVFALGLGIGIGRRQDTQQMERLILVGMGGLLSTAVSVNGKASDDGSHQLSNLAGMIAIVGAGVSLGMFRAVPGNALETIAFGSLGVATGIAAPYFVEQVADDVKRIKNGMAHEKESPSAW